MNVVSSFRPLHEDEEWKRNQLLAKRSWEMWARQIILFCDDHLELRSRKTTFIPGQSWPSIRAMAEVAGSLPGYTAILNGDIVVKPEILKLERRMMTQSKRCASSRRYHFDPNTCDFDAATLGDDRGRDIFIARFDVWRAIGRELPSEFRIGNGRWDAAITNVFRLRYDAGFIDFTAMRLIFHPIHGGRRRPYDEQIAQNPLLVDPETWTHDSGTISQR